MGGTAINPSHGRCKNLSMLFLISMCFPAMQPGRPCMVPMTVPNAAAGSSCKCCPPRSWLQTASRGRALPNQCKSKSHIHTCGAPASSSRTTARSFPTSATLAHLLPRPRFSFHSSCVMTSEASHHKHPVGRLLGRMYANTFTGCIPAM